MKLIAITGGIGSGKSVVARMVNVMGYKVYDCDSRAKALMTQDADVKRLLIEAFGSETFLADGAINRQHLSAKAFADDQTLARLNAIVHPATSRDMLRWAGERAASGDRLAFVETALLRTAGMGSMVDAVWHVTAPQEIRVQRVMARSGLTAEQVLDRMAAQSHEEQIGPSEHAIVNDGHRAVLPQVIALLSQCV